MFSVLFSTLFNTIFGDRAIKLCAGTGRNRKPCTAVDQAQILAKAVIKQSAQKAEPMQDQPSMRLPVTTQCADSPLPQSTIRHGFSPRVERAHTAAFPRVVAPLLILEEMSSSLPAAESSGCIFPHMKAPILLHTTSSPDAKSSHPHRKDSVVSTTSTTPSSSSTLTLIEKASGAQSSLSHSHTESATIGVGRYRHPANATCEWLERRKSQEEQMLGCQRLFGQPGFEKILGPHPFDEEIAQLAPLSRVNSNDSNSSSSSGKTTSSRSESIYDENTGTLITRGFDSSPITSIESAQYWLQGVGRSHVRVKRIRIIPETEEEKLRRLQKRGGYEMIRGGNNTPRKPITKPTQYASVVEPNMGYSPSCLHSTPGLRIDASIVPPWSQAGVLRFPTQLETVMTPL
ncbi:hypothetical protein W97_00710 [Coniosporium apollinis CBS 100218]|uniref:Uncharacterized protein n=1 Tax=Coniosporium apollinis (strain CBS 100218) TaxID=1168221 RepID=R7YHX2_CONA1|nr:uncharacterized protein W97_00710 [Coniosporium apollinis CBS 100218]EON61495.1 hypothetical protein W97_00710 [Coniosporium apollinis CBS 100218]